mmetsp:Transcript_16790/g.41287  ORF Transcript_16790/g.41287 Transcript_16790/m.41287 type:complete len:1097 (+) Transcript_16790:37-3327(+)
MTTTEPPLVEQRSADALEDAIRAAQRGAARNGAARGDDAPRPSLSAPSPSSVSYASTGASLPPSRRRAKGRCPAPQHAVERAVAAAFAWIGRLVGRHPVSVFVGSLLIALALSAGLVKVSFEARSHKLYIPQKDFMARDARELESYFGTTPEPGILILERKDGEPLDDKASVLAMLDLHQEVVGMRVPFGDRLIAYDDICYRRFVGMLDDYECIVSSPLELWWYQRAQVQGDEDVSGTIREAIDDNRADFGTEAGEVKAMQIKYFFHPRSDEAEDERYDMFQAWEEALRDLLFVKVGSGSSADEPLKVTYWSTNFNELEAQSFVRDDSYLMGLSLAFITIYVCITLGGATADCRQTRMFLGSTCAVCTALSMSSGFGIASLLGIPLQPISPIVCFTLLGVAVDDMIIIVMAFEATPRDDPIDERLSDALSRAGSTITVTSVTSAVAFLTGYFVDFPALAYFCVPASLCIVMVYFLQMTFFASCLVLDSKRATARRLDCCPCFELTDDQVYRVPRMLGLDRQTSSAKKGERVRPLQVLVNKHWAKFLMRNPVRFLVVAGFLSLVLASGLTMRHITVGLPPKLSLPDGSPILGFLDGLDDYWAGAQMQEVQLILRDVDMGDPATVRAVDRTVARLEALPHVLHFAPRWDKAFVAWRNCTWAEVMQSADTEPITMAAFLEDDETHKCGARAAASTPGCEDDDEAFKKLSGGHECAVAASHCAKPAVGWKIVQRHCPATCGVCAERASGWHSAAWHRRHGGRQLQVASVDKAVPTHLGPTMGGKQFENDVSPGPDQVAVESRMIFYVHMSNSNAQAWREYEALAAEVAKEPSLGGSVYHFKYEFAYCDLLMPLFGLKNLLMAAGTIFVVVSLFLPVSIALLSTFTVVCIDVILLGLITAVGMSLNTITLVTLLLALALAIDYSCHIGHAYVVAPGRTREEKVREAIGTIGFSIINAAGSTLLGTLFLAASQSPVFRIFFLLIWSTIFLGLVSGMAFVPVVLSLIGPLDHTLEPDHLALDGAGPEIFKSSWQRRAKQLTVEVGESEGDDVSLRPSVPPSDTVDSELSGEGEDEEDDGNDMVDCFFTPRGQGHGATGQQRMV